MTTKLRALFTAALVTCASPAFALNIVLSNDDGLTSNLAALYLALKAAGHDVIVSVPVYRPERPRRGDRDVQLHGHPVRQ
jgi:hypothetical protein